MPLFYETYCRNCESALRDLCGFYATLILVNPDVCVAGSYCELQETRLIRSSDISSLRHTGRGELLNLYKLKRSEEKRSYTDYCMYCHRLNRVAV
ncbi:hypothetical protein J8K94_09390 [Bacteroides fragilis]|uniref:hypothetical protein n=1 Tax=Bacteroides TaxID=816 RepID=UPI00202F6D9F|nr:MULTISPECIES: hypothetical protein [Bacteroides]MCM0205503.1 hypothetical protein [Bacteroides fragilis]MCM0303201.1 hypothetical protein [Bacteroides fragilis]MDV6187597.1 hypothetical protein [Bacteroides hominis (ex Liu et al. 2022)]